ncbi:hypothetical protein BGZ95_001749 [Linnemannia exigua]|uniref:DNA polymerase delta subunit 4 n=1 Tax=Linnemannia exigua TaxID=604196 RepID=A0AAD4DIT9_9FUNG|nr:hypothetical protein BGZ95_001749 [Linnemannia exigua]
MAPPKKTSVDSTTAATTNNFFTRGRKPTTTQRVVTAKKAFNATAAPKVQHRQRDEEEDEDEVTDEIEEAETDEDVEVHTPQQEQVQQVGLGHHQQHQVDEDEDEDEDKDENDSLHEEIEQTDEDQDSDAPRMTRATRTAAAAKATTGLKKKDSVTRPAAAGKPKITKPTLPTRSTAAKNKAPYVAPNVGDIHSGFHQADLSDSEKLLRQFDLASKYGPCTDMTRLERWERAFNLFICHGQLVPVDVAVALLITDRQTWFE